ncbi:hypothetical protein FYJ84_13410 [Veillonellaceae bacterium WCA-693-APC-5D-A]|uniref:Uncharacterized protein n=1 Tax=Anaerovibrio slackiae TaxID=2652309 RepID=A0A6I2UK65_9FIRM|nr:hypothetical protein [Anaerovibrio slackiae]MSU09964.1 hypothetical protein [Anaerovibrio slackiae]
MFVQANYESVEQVCYDERHIQQVLESITNMFDGYFERYLLRKAGKGLSEEDISSLQSKFCIKPVNKKINKNLSDNYREIICDAIEDFEKDRDDYINIFDMELIEDYEEDLSSFKSKVLKCDCPIIRKALQAKRAKELDKYRAEFSRADPEELHTVIYNLCEFGMSYQDEYSEYVYEEIDDYGELGMGALDTEEYTVYGVIGGGIKTHMLYKVYPEFFSNRSRSALWALWFLTDKDNYDLETDSEFLMIDVKKNIVQQNYFYPYELFAYYAFEIYKMLENKALECGVEFNHKYRYVYVNSFLEYVAFEHENEISEIKKENENKKENSYGGLEYA